MAFRAYTFIKCSSYSKLVLMPKQTTIFKFIRHAWQTPLIGLSPRPLSTFKVNPSLRFTNLSFRSCSAYVCTIFSFTLWFNNRSSSAYFSVWWIWNKLLLPLTGVSRFYKITSTLDKKGIFQSKWDRIKVVLNLSGIFPVVLEAYALKWEVFLLFLPLLSPIIFTFPL